MRRSMHANVAMPAASSHVVENSNHEKGGISDGTRYRIVDEKKIEVWAQEMKMRKHQEKHVSTSMFAYGERCFFRREKEQPFFLFFFLRVWVDRLASMVDIRIHFCKGFLELHAKSRRV